MQIDKTVPIEEWKKLGFYSAQSWIMEEQNWWRKSKIIWKNNEPNKHFIHKTLSEEQRQVFLDANFDLLEQDFIEIKTPLN
jgi:hypothetical protein